MGSRELHVVRTLYLRDLTAVLFSPFPYLLGVLACVLSAYFAGVFLNTVSALSLMVSADPLRIPIVFTALAVALYLGISSSIAIAHEREQKTLEVLFYGPVTPGQRVAALFLRDLSVFVVIALLSFAETLLVSRATNLTLGASSLAILAFSIPLVCPMVSFSLLVSAAFRRTGSAVLFFVTLLAALAGLQLVSMILDSVPAEGASLLLLQFRRALSLFLAWAQWLSPFSYVSRVGEFLETGGEAPAWTAAAAVAYALILLAAATVALRRRGAGA